MSKRQDGDANRGNLAVRTLVEDVLLKEVFFQELGIAAKYMYAMRFTFPNVYFCVGNNRMTLIATNNRHFVPVLTLTAGEEDSSTGYNFSFSRKVYISEQNRFYSFSFNDISNKGLRTFDSRENTWKNVVIEENPGFFKKARGFFRRDEKFIDDRIAIDLENIAADADINLYEATGAERYAFAALAIYLKYRINYFVVNSVAGTDEAVSIEKYLDFNFLEKGKIDLSYMREYFPSR